MSDNNSTRRWLRDSENEMRNAGVVGLVCFAAYALSTALSGYGIAVSLSVLNLNWLVMVAGACLATAIMTALAYVHWSLVGKFYLRMRHGIAPWYVAFWILVVGAVGLTVSAASFFTSFSASVYLTQSETVNTTLRAVQTREVSAPMGAFARAQTEVAAIADQVRGAAQAASDRERLQGNSCGPTKSGPGPITEIRAQHARDARTHADAARAMSDDANVLRDRLLGATGQFEINAIYNAAENLVLDPRRRALLTWAERTQAQMLGARISYDGEQYTCVDRELAAQLAELVAVASAPVELSETPPTIRTANVFDAMIVAFGKIQRLLGPAPANPEDYTVLPYLIFSIVLDAIGAFAAVVIAYRTSDRLSPDERAKYVRLNWAIEHLVWPIDDDTTYLLMPVDGDPLRRNLAKHLASELEIAPRPTRFRVRMSSLKLEVPDLPGHFARMTGFPSFVDIYVIKSDAENALHKLHAKTIKVLKFDDRNYQDFPAPPRPTADVTELKMATGA